QARHNGRPNRVHLRYGLIVHLQLLSTPPRGDAVTFGYRVPEHSDRDFHPADSTQLQAHRGPGSPGDWGPTPAGPPNRLLETLSTIAVNRRGPRPCRTPSWVSID